MDLKLAATVFVTIFIAELGDKTQLATLLFASSPNVSRLTIFACASVALILAVAIGVLGGGIIAQYVSDRLLKYVAGVGFILIGLWSLLTA